MGLRQDRAGSLEAFVVQGFALHSHSLTVFKGPCSS
jgi:hypothetical protein